MYVCMYVRMYVCMYVCPTQFAHRTEGLKSQHGEPEVGHHVV